jgi:uncharacterized membrane protein YebE (DUF533 family)
MIDAKNLLANIDSNGLVGKMLGGMANVQDLQIIASGAKTPQDAAQVYLAALLVCDSQCTREQDYLASLAEALKLEPAFAASLQQELLAMSQQKAL